MIISKFNSADNQFLFSSLVNDIFDYVMEGDLVNMAPGRYGIRHLSEDEAFFLVQEYETVANNVSGPEFHHKFIDVQFLVYGEEKIGWDIMNDEEYAAMNQQVRFNACNDIGFLANDQAHLNYNIMKPGAFYMFTPRTMFVPGLAVTTPCKVKKVIIKIDASLLSDSFNVQSLNLEYYDGVSYSLN